MAEKQAKKPAAIPIALTAAEIIAALTHGLAYSADPAPAVLQEQKGSTALVITLTADQAQRLRSMNDAKPRR